MSLFDQRSVVLLDSRGYENASSKLGMRLSVIAADLLGMNSCFFSCFGQSHS